MSSIEAFDRDCVRTWSLDAPAVAVSPDGRWAAGYPGLGTPIADDHHIRLIRVHDAATWSTDLGSARHVASIAFTEAGVHAELDDGTERTLPEPSDRAGGAGSAGVVGGRSGDATAVGSESEPTPQWVHVDGGLCESGRIIDGEGRAVASVRPVGDLDAYRTPLLIVGDGPVRVRANAMWDVSDQRNVIGTIPAGTRVLGLGPLKDQEPGYGVGYAIAVEDASGHRCRGYVSITVARPF